MEDVASYFPDLCFTIFVKLFGSPSIWDISFFYDVKGYLVRGASLRGRWNCPITSRIQDQVRLLDNVALERDARRFLFPESHIRPMIHRGPGVAYLSSTPGRVFLSLGKNSSRAGEGEGKERMRIHATGGAYLNSRLTFIYLATFNFYGRDPADSSGPAGSSRCVVPGTSGAPGAWYNIRGRAAPLN